MLSSNDLNTVFQNSLNLKQPINSYNVDVYPANKGYIAKLSNFIDSNTTIYNFIDNSTKTNNNKNNTDVDTVVLLDVSGSMGNVNPVRLVNSIIPSITKQLGYSDDSTITLITFESTSKIYKIKVKELPNFKFNYGGGTYMAPAITLLVDHFKSVDSNTPIRILTISDGDVSDQVNTVTMSSKLAGILKSSNYRISSHAIRYFTSNAHPDTRALSSVLQLNSCDKQAKLLDIADKVDNNIVSNTITNLYIDDGLNSTNCIKTKDNENILMSTPWGVCLNSIPISKGDNSFWLSALPKNGLTINDVPVVLNINKVLDAEKFNIILQTKINYFMNHLKILKIVNTVESKTEIDNIVKYFSEIEKDIANVDTDLAKLIEDRSVLGRLAYYKALLARSSRSIATKMKEIANDDRVGKFNSAQSADYLRQIDVNRLGKALAKRAQTSTDGNTDSLDFSQIARNEVVKMKINLKELDGIDDSNHLVSFYSQDTTLSGIKALCSLDNATLDMLDVNDIIKLLNLVGVAYNAPIGDYPDPMTYRVDKMFIGTYISLSDVLTAFETGKGAVLQVPGSDKNDRSKDIVNVIPVYDDDRIHQFLRKYAYTLLSYTASIGMRRVIADIPMTYGYSMCAGLWQMVHELNNSNKSTVNIETFIKLCKGYKIASGKYFDHLNCLFDDSNKVVDNPNSYRMSHYLANNGITNLIRPMLDRVDTTSPENMSSILRALYSFEVWQQVRKTYKHSEDNANIISKSIDELLNIDLTKNKTKIAELYTNEDSNPIYYDKYTCNDSKANEYIKMFWYVDYMTLLPEMLSAANSNNVDNIKNMPVMNETSIKKALGINYSLHKFKMYNIAQALLYTTKADRVDDDKKKATIIDFLHEKDGDRLLSMTVKQKYHNLYQKELVEKKKVEVALLTDDLVNKILHSQTKDQFIDLLTNGLGAHEYDCKVSIINTASDGFIKLKDKILDLKVNCMLRLDIIKVLLLGVDDNNNKVWNNGNVLFTPDLQKFKNIVISLGGDIVWENINKEYMSRRRHIYRDKRNRHDHGNDKPSYWCLGWMTLDLMIKDISKEAFDEYKRIHVGCCGLK